jgi:hypothetical protein
MFACCGFPERFLSICVYWANVYLCRSSFLTWYFLGVREDLQTTAMHELCHGLFMDGVVVVPDGSSEAGFSSTASTPGRYDRFLAVNSTTGVTASCSDPGQFYNAITNEGLRFTDPASPGTDFGLYSPTRYASGSSTYHHDPARLSSDCAKLQISNADCSDLMTHELKNGYTQRSIGEPVRRTMMTMLGSSKGQGAGSCAVAASSGKSGSDTGLFGDAKTTVLNLPTWSLYAIGAAVLAGVVLLVGAVITAFRRR